MVTWTQTAALNHEARRAKPTRNTTEGNHEVIEAKLHRGILDECRRRGWPPPIHCRMDKATTTVKGAPDFVVLADRGRVFLVEAKTRKGKLRPEQVQWIRWAEKFGHTVHVVRSLKAFLEVVG